MLCNIFAFLLPVMIVYHPQREKLLLLSGVNLIKLPNEALDWLVDLSTSNLSLSLSLSLHGTQCLKKIVSYLIYIRAFWSWIWCHWTLSLLPCSIIGWKNESLGWYLMNLKLNHPSSIKIIIIIYCHWSILFFTITIFSFLFIKLIGFELVDLLSHIYCEAKCWLLLGRWMSSYA